VSLHITPAMCETAYELLRTTPPFRGWHLPHADEVRFKISGDLWAYGSHWHDPKGHEIRISYRNIKQLGTLTRVMAHEMCHMREVQLKSRSDVMHGRTFQRLKAQVCKWHHFDIGAF
jgi:hypothetical protein